jgi:hypothetical protein
MHASGRHGAALLLCGAVLLLPLLLIQNQPSASASPAADGHGTGRHEADGSHPTGRNDRLTSDLRSRADSHGAGAHHVTRGSSRAEPRTRPVGGATSLPWTAPVETTLPSEEVARHIAVATTAPSTTTSTTVTTVAAPPPPVTTTTVTSTLVASEGSGSVHYGQVTFYAHPAGTCASPWLPFGTVVEITNPANGASVSCVVNDREADTARSIDLATATFARLAPLSQGVIDAELRW